MVGLLILAIAIVIVIIGMLWRKVNANKKAMATMNPTTNSSTNNTPIVNPQMPTIIKTDRRRRCVHGRNVRSCSSPSCTNPAGASTSQSPLPMEQVYEMGPRIEQQPVDLRHPPPVYAEDQPPPYRG